jgi:hypothetical protein
MLYRHISVLLAVMAIALFGSIAKADAPKEIKTEKGKPVVLGNFLSAPANCGSNPGPIPLLTLREKPSHGVVGLQIVVTDVAASDQLMSRECRATLACEWQLLEPQAACLTNPLQARR